MLSCALCGGEGILIGAVSQKTIFRCWHCRLVQFSELPSKDCLSEHYSIYSYSEIRQLDSLTEYSISQVLDRIQALLNRNQFRLLDVGCGQGDVLRIALKRGIEVLGVEYSDAAVALCKSQGIPCIKIGQFDGLVEDERFVGKFDAVVSFEVLEHVVDPVGFWRFVESVLKPGGIFILSTPNANSITRLLRGWKVNLSYPEHLFCYSRQVIETFLQSKKFDIICAETRGLSSGFFMSLRRARFLLSVPSNQKGTPEFSVENLSNHVQGSKNRRFFLLIIARNSLNYLLSFLGVGDTLRLTLRKRSSGDSIGRNLD